MATSSLGRFADLSSYRRLVDAQKAKNAEGLNNLIQNYIEGAQQGNVMVNLPEILQQQNEARRNKALSDQIALQLQGLQLENARNPTAALDLALRSKLAQETSTPGTGIVVSPAGLESEIIAQPGAITPEQQVALQARDIAATAAGIPVTLPTAESGTPIVPVTGVSGRPTGYSQDLGKAIAESIALSRAKGANTADIAQQRLLGLMERELMKREFDKENLEVKERIRAMQEATKEKPMVINGVPYIYNAATRQLDPVGVPEGFKPKTTPSKPLPRQIAERVSDAQSAVDNLITLKSYIDNPDVISISGPVAGRTLGVNPLSETVGKFDGVRNTAKQVIGKYMEGGVLRLEDEKKYDKIIPSKTMLPNVQQNQAQILYNSLKKKLQRDLESYQKSGYDVTELMGTIEELDRSFMKSRSSIQPLPEMEASASDGFTRIRDPEGTIRRIPSTMAQEAVNAGGEIVE